MSDWTWDPLARVYRGPDGAAVPAMALLALRDALSDGLGAAMVDLTRRLWSGTLSLPAWAEQSATLLADALLAGYALGRGGLAQMTGQDRDRLRGLLDRQLAATRDFAVALAAALPAGSPAPVMTAGEPAPRAFIALPHLPRPTLPRLPNPLASLGRVVQRVRDRLRPPPPVPPPPPAVAPAAPVLTENEALTRAALYESAVVSAHEQGRASAWDATPPEVPPLHPRCRCAAEFVGEGGATVMYWRALLGACPRCRAKEAAYNPWRPDAAGVAPNGTDVGGDS